jgi:DNA helicase HerA-like ATPase
MQVKFKGNSDGIDKYVTTSGIYPDYNEKPLNLDEACLWFEWVWENYDNDFFTQYKNDEGKEWADDDLKALMVFLTGYKRPKKSSGVSGYKKIRSSELHNLHTNKTDESFEQDIVNSLRGGNIVIIDLSQGSPAVQSLFSERICKAVFNNAMNRFISNLQNNFIQFYFEEAHNLFPKKDDKDLSQIYNRLAKEGAKLHIGMTYATQEVSSISSNILKNTQNWFIAHLNNEDEIRELRKYYDFSDFMTALLKFSSSNDKGFVRMKTYTNPFIVPVQIDEFKVVKDL